MFEIDIAERVYNILLLDQNLQALIKNSKSFIIQVFPRLAPLSLEPDEHFLSKDLSFYKVARLVDSEARQARLKEWEKKLHEGILRQALAASCLASNSIIHFPAQKKKPTACPI